MPTQEEQRDETLIIHHIQRGPDQLTRGNVSVAYAIYAKLRSRMATSSIPQEAVQLYKDTPGGYSPGALIQLDFKGDNLVRKFRMYHTLCSIQESLLRKMDPRLGYAIQQYEMIPDQYPRIGRTLTKGVSADYSGWVHRIPRIRGLPYQASKAERCQYISKTMAGRIC